MFKKNLFPLLIILFLSLGIISVLGQAFGDEEVSVRRRQRTSRVRFFEEYSVQDSNNFFPNFELLGASFKQQLMDQPQLLVPCIFAIVFFAFGFIWLARLLKN